VARRSVLIPAKTAPLPAVAVGGGIRLDSREYKLMLEPEPFTGAAAEEAVARFGLEHLGPAT
jgi:hypothetical protein